MTHETLPNGSVWNFLLDPKLAGGDPATEIRKRIIDAERTADQTFVTAYGFQQSQGYYDLANTLRAVYSHIPGAPAIPFGPTTIRDQAIAALPENSQIPFVLQNPAGTGELFFGSVPLSQAIAATTPAAGAGNGGIAAIAATETSSPPWALLAAAGLAAILLLRRR